MNIFISYRRDDSKALAGRLADRLRNVTGIDEVFLDVEAIPPGADFRKHIREKIKSYPIRLVVIGPQWTSLSGSDGRPRILDSEDVVAMEVEAILAEKRGRTIPVLVDNAQMPSKSDIPASLHPLRDLSAVSLRHESFQADFDAVLGAIFNNRVRGAQDTYFSRHPVQAAFVYGLFGFAISAVLFFLGLKLARDNHVIEGTLGGSDGAATFYIGLWFAIGTFGPALLRLRRGKRR